MTPKQEEALRDYLQEVIVPLIEEVLVKKLGQAMTFAKKELPKRECDWVGLTDGELDDLHRALKIRLMGTFDTKDIYRAIEAKLKEKNT